MSVISQRTLNRTLLQRQFLTERTTRAPLDVTGHLVALQAQEPDAPYIGLWTRITDFRHDGLTSLLHDRSLVRAKLLRNTQHLVTADDFRWLWPLLEPVLGRTRQGAFGRAAAGIPEEELRSAGRELLAGEPLTRPRLGRLLAERFPGRDATALAYVVQSLVAHIHPPPSGTWGQRGATPLTLAETWLGRPLDTGARLDTLVPRYLAAFGPASVADLQAWSGLTRLREPVEALRSRLRVLRGPDGRELLDLPDAPLADPDLPAPVRFLPAYDNLLLGHADRTRVIGDEDRARVVTGSEVRPVFLVDGVVHGVWALKEHTLQIEPYRPLTGAQAAEVEQEAWRVLDFVRAAPAKRGKRPAAEPGAPSVAFV
ncbi:winged helix DNA-binding domain-containing protein [Streptomyces sp. NPDC015131]|uniref:winged helix DNA-binding domain-containing protein n=1 Tax=Streptomyces sp. NPDC015131 TaxID=3364941 RepID=UPI003701CC32